MTKREHAPGYVPNDAYTQSDWNAVSDNPPLTDAELAAARPGPEGMPPAMAEAFRKRAGRPKAEAKAVPVSLRVPPSVLAAYKAEGPGWQTRMNEALAFFLLARDLPTPEAGRRGTVRAAAHIKPSGSGCYQETKRSGVSGQYVAYRPSGARARRPKPKSA